MRVISRNVSKPDSAHGERTQRGACGVNTILKTSLWSHLDGPERAIIIGRPADHKLAHETATVLQRELMTSGWRSGDVVGTLPEIRQRYGLGRLAFREAIGILEMRGWVESRRGGGGGLVLTLPTVQDLTALTMVYLCLKDARTDQLIEARRSVHRAIVRKLVMCGGEHRALSEFRSTNTATQIDSHPSLPNLRFSRWLAAQTGNRCFAFIMDFVLALYEESAGTHSSAPIAAEEALWDAICSQDKPRANIALDRYLDCIECLRPGEKLGLPRAFPRNGSGGSATYAARLTRVLIGKIAQCGQRGPIDFGTEAEISSRHHLHHKIVRQAVRVLEDIGVVVSRRGGQGGLTSREPDLAVVIDLIPPLLFQRGVSYNEVFKAAGFLKLETARLAALHVCKAIAGKNVATWTEQLLCTTPMWSHELITMENTLVDLAENSVLTACDRGLLLYSPVGQPELHAQAAAGIASMRNIVDAILRGDPQAAETLASRRLYVT